MPADPLRGEIWTADLDPTVGHEQGGRRPVLVVSSDRLNRGPRGLVIVVPATGTGRGWPTHVPVAPPEGGLIKPSVLMVEQVRSASKDRFRRRHGTVTPATLEAVTSVLRDVLDL
jgi:mRNA interferase MazF